VVTFPTWHRPYVALYEQILASKFPDIVGQYSQANSDLGSRLETASQIWRLPYWDWATNQDIPQEWSAQQITVYDLNGNQTSVPNPLNKYAFHPVDPSFEGTAYARWPATLRSPNSSNANAVSQPNRSNRRLVADFSQCRKNVIDLFPPNGLPQDDPWGQISNHNWNVLHENQGSLTSLESIHDQIHVDVGGQGPGGHMADPAAAAFDPIFWLHHCNVDRVLALWQAVYPDVYVSPGPAGDGIFRLCETDEGSFIFARDMNPNARDIDVNTPLEPFWKDQNDFGSSTDVYSTGTYGYTYPEIAAANATSAQQLSNAIYQKVHSLYGSSSFFSSFLTARKNVQAAPQVAAESLQHGFQKLAITPTVKGNAIHIPANQKFVLPRALPKASAPPPSNPHPPPAANPHPPAANPHPPAANPAPHPANTPGANPPASGRPAAPTHPHSHPANAPGANPPASGRPANVGPQGGAVLPSHPSSGADYVVTPETYRDWIANVTCEKYALGGSGRIVFFLGPEEQIPSNPSDWYESPLYVGSFSIFATDPALTGCGNCKTQEANKTRVGGTVHLTETLIRCHVPLTGDEPVAYLKENLHWRISNKDENLVAREDVPSLKVVVQSAGYSFTEGDDRPQRSEWIRHAPVTAGRPGGVNHGGEFTST
jgi:tyrosinase